MFKSTPLTKYLITAKIIDTVQKHSVLRTVRGVSIVNSISDSNPVDMGLIPLLNSLLNSPEFALKDKKKV